MRYISRRSLLNGLASVPVLAALSPLDVSSSAIEALPMRGDVNCGDELRLVLHGAFAVILDDSGVRLYAPTVRDHSYKAGCWGQELRLEEGSSYPFNPVSELCPKKLPKIDPTTNAVLYRKTLEKSIQDICFCSLSGPLPNEIHSLRRVFKVHPNDAFFDGPDAKDINANLKTFSLVHVLVYKFKTSFRFEDFPDIPWKRTYREMFVDVGIGAKSSAVRMGLPSTFHFFAEPDTNVQQQKAFPAIVDHFSDVDLSVTETEPSHKCDWSTSLKGFHRWEQHGLLERSKLLHHTDCPSMEPRGHVPANCGKLFVDNRTSIP